MTEAPTTNDPVELAMEAVAKGAPAADPARELLTHQTRLVKWEIADRRAAFGLKLLLGAAGLIVAAAFAAMAWSASQADGLVVEAFAVPPALAAQGATGEVVARGVLDRLGELDRGANSLAAVRVADAWTEDVKVELPQTGVSLGEVQRALRQWLGHETHLTGEVVQTPTGVRVTARTGIGRTVTAEGPAEALPQLASRAADGLFADARPIQWGEYLYRQGRYDEARPILAAALANADDPDDRAHAELLLGMVASRQFRPADALGHFLRAAKARDRVIASGALSSAAAAADALGRTGDSVAYNAQALKRLGSTRGRVADWYRKGLQANVYADRFDFQAAARTLAPIVGRPNPGTSGDYRNTYARFLVQLHEVAAAYRIRQDQDDPAIYFHAQDWPGFVGLAEEAQAAGDRSALTRAVRSYGLAMMDRPQEALAEVQEAPADCYFCWGARGVALGQLGDVAGSEQAFAHAYRIRPENMSGVVVWGRERLRRGDVKGARQVFQMAQQKAPRFADPREAMGEALMAERDFAAAEAAFRGAEPFAPRWGRLHLKWGQALARLGKPAEAQAHWRTAATLDLTAAEKAELAQVLR